MTKYFVDGNGGYIGGFDGVWISQEPDEDGSEVPSIWQEPAPPAGATEVPQAPLDARQVWDGKAWSEAPPVRQMVLKSTVMQRLIDINKMGVAQAALWAQPNAFARWFAPDHPAVYCDDPDATAFVHALGLDPAIILAP